MKTGDAFNYGSVHGELEKMNNRRESHDNKKQVTNAKTDDDSGDMLALLENREALYDFLSQIYKREVTLDFLEVCSAKDSPMLRMAKDLGSMEESQLKNGFEKLTRYLVELQSMDLNQSKLELDAEYASLFLGVLGRPPHPSESVYTSGEQLMMQKARDEVLLEYEKEGLDKPKEFTEPEDHIAVELQFMALLCQKTSDDFKRAEWDKALIHLSTQKRFLQRHLLRWVPSLTKDILEGAELGFYIGAATITDGFIRTDVDSVNELLEYALTVSSKQK